MILVFRPLLACLGFPFTTFMMGLPLAVSISTFGLGSLGIVLLEALGLHQRESVSWQQAIRASVVINAYSTLMGVLFMFMYVGNELLILIINVSFSWCLGQVLLRLLTARRGSPQPLIMQAITYLTSFAVILFIFVAGGILNFGIGSRGGEALTLNSGVTAILGLLTLNFLLTWILESYSLTGQWRDKSPVKLCQTVFWINVRSYVYILFPIAVLGGFFQRRL